MNNKELIEVCKPYEIKERVVFPSNIQYGFSKIIRKRVFYPSFLPICAHFEHSSPPFYDEIWDMEKKFLTNLFFHREDYATQWNNKFKGKARTFMSPFVWYKENKSIIISKKAKGSLFFIHHSRKGVDREHNQEKIIGIIENLDEVQKPVTFCFYYLDIQKGLHLPYQEKGYNVVSAGHLDNPNFIKGFYDLISNYKFALTNSIGGHLLFATNLGLPVSYFEELEPVHTSNLIGFEDSRKRLLKSKTYNHAKNLFRGIHQNVSIEQEEFANKMLGVYSKSNNITLFIILYKSLFQYIFYKIVKKIKKRN